MTAPVATRLEEARSLLRHHFGYPDFRPGQRRVVQSVLAGRDILAVLPTGAGKSVCFQIPALVLGQLTIVVSPLISLMQDQVQALRSRGVAAELLNSTLDKPEQNRVLDALRQREVPLLYVSPERLSSLTPFLREIEARPARLVVDEAHCVDEWGHDFRPSYRRLGWLRQGMGMPPAVALTGSATPETREVIQRSLRLRKPDLLVGSFDRPNLWFGVAQVSDQRDRVRRLLETLRGGDRIAIVYAPTRNLTESLVRMLRQHGFLADPYHAGLTRRERAQVLDRFLSDEIEVVVATSAFGMGIDKPNVRVVVHWMLPPSPEAYYQEAGRAGRDGDFARCLLLYGRGDATLHRRQLDVTFPPRRLLERVWQHPGERERVPQNVLASVDRLSRELRPERGYVDWRPVETRRRRATARIDATESYATGAGCRRAALLGYFGETVASCSGCDHCSRRIRPHAAEPVVNARLTRLRRALADSPSPWAGAVLEPETLLRLAKQPPSTAAELADTAGVGPVLAEKLGGRILEALGARAPAESKRDDPVVRALRDWRAETGRCAGVPDYSILGDDAIGELARLRPRDIPALSRIPGLGPRFLRKWGTEVLTLVQNVGVAGDV
ncbi:MAG TPA: ATP-dependent DNA helicase RecQ [Gemmatimonadales bacterium]|jgi:ATP-dependent DNA helicase RecQ|nr:ATP-dependent DNA helicase RecQ [Gemmatimonadales bacterium]